MRAVLNRLQFFVITLWAALTINFLIPRLMPGSPVQAMMARFRGSTISPSSMKAMEAAFGNGGHGSFFGDYVAYLNNMAHGRFGTSVLLFPSPVSSVIRSALPWTLGLIGVTTIISFALGTTLGMYAAWRRHGFVDSAILPISIVTIAFPYFWLGLMAIYAFNTKLGWFPAGFGYNVASGENIAFSWSFIKDVLYHAVLPGLSIVVTSVGGWMLLMRNNMLGSLNEDYVRMAKAKGLPNRRIMFNYAGRTAILPSVTGFALAIGFVISGALLVEVVFNYPGLGFLLYQAVTTQDYPLMQAIFFLITVAVLVAAVLADVVNAIIDPRARDAN
jgi:peptide/nickel transport system permease protein